VGVLAHRRIASARVKMVGEYTHPTLALSLRLLSVLFVASVVFVILGARNYRRRIQQEFIRGNCLQSG
jgi:hypothetical protein